MPDKLFDEFVRRGMAAQRAVNEAVAPRFPIKVEFSRAQWKLAKELIEAHERLGDLKAGGFNLTFDDYEGLQAFKNRVFGLGSGSTANYISMNAIVDKIDAAVRKATAPPVSRSEAAKKAWITIRANRAAAAAAPALPKSPRNRA